MLKRFAFIAALVGITCCGSTGGDAPDPNKPSTDPTPNPAPVPTATVGDVSLDVMTFNIRYDNTGDGQNIWQNRRDRAANAIKFYDPDVFGTQETLHNHLEDLKSRLPQYAVIGVGREDGKEAGEYSPVWYKKDRFTLQSSGYFWLSETPNVPSKGWDGACERIATWAILQDKYTNNAIFFINTHLDHQGVTARREGVNLLFQKINEYSLGLPVICTGDFNSSPDSDVIAHITDTTSDNHLTDSRKVSPVVYGPSWSWHDFGALSYSQRPLLDYVFIRGGLDVNRYGVCAEDENGQYLSDHAPVVVNVSYK